MEGRKYGRKMRGWMEIGSKQGSKEGGSVKGGAKDA